MPKIFVLDTSVILYDADSINNFEEHDVAVPLTVLEEIDQFKKGSNVLNLQAREFVRQLDRRSADHDLRTWVPLDGPSRGRLRVIAEEGRSDEASSAFGSRKNDHRILDSALALARAEAPRRVILVSKDISLRVKARALGLEAEDYESVKVADVTHLDRGKSEIEVTDDDLVDQLYETGAVPATAIVPGELPPANHYFILRGGARSALACYNARSGDLERVVKTGAYGIQPRNAEQTFALHAMLNPDVPLVSLAGPAGTGKTLLALAAALDQRRRFRQIFLARPIVPLSNKDIGYLPGDIQSKIGPYMQPLWDSLGVIKDQFEEGHKEAKRIDEMTSLGKLHVVPLAYIRGRSFSNIVFVVDEAQNLTPHEVKTIITRAGEGTKIVFTGDIFQIDTPYLDAESNGLSYLIDRMRGHPLYAHVSLDKGERSELANLASQLL
jgi:PhoH-like ATPase